MIIDFMSPRKLKPKPAVEKSINQLADAQKSQELETLDTYEMRDTHEDKTRKISECLCTKHWTPDLPSSSKQKARASLS